MVICLVGVPILSAIGKTL